jgi:glycosyltransferase involved in cell wall biosynthesis
VITNNAASKPLEVSAPADFRVVAFMAAYNEEDIIVQSIRKWTDQGVRVHVLENWSTDATYDLAKQLERQLPVTVERFPQSGPSQFFDWGAMLARIEVLSGEIEADWFVRRGADEVLRSPWPGVSYRDGLYLVDQAGFNCVDHTIVEFHPVDDGFETGMDHEAYFKHFDFKHLSHPFQRKAWKNYGQPISTIPSAGHDVVFAGRRVYPFKFLLKHYSFRSQSHGEKKVFRERKARWNPGERARGWHVHYDAMDEGHQFLRSTTEKECFEEEHFNKTYLVERLSGIGVDR